ncbi:hypothetical protein [Halobacteriovorax sp. DA5]|uniref:hypothetical protein n=1 Tax=Halobacteriovorax sp. DA5 TaxID=2067553 RepID=UPI000CD27296|nr:hypothetical protein [Halobacteriovorax sp. DA5]POB14792.1 hypothetical protein C0Z22_00020 [Halobacteriovorax sp. DA5]
MTRQLLRITSIFLFVGYFSTTALAETEYTLGASYRFSSNNCFSNSSTFDLGATVTGSMLVDESHEYGISLIYNVNWEENKQGKIISETSAFMPEIFYRHHFFLTDESARFPMIFYVGPSIGYIKTQTQSYANEFSLSFGVGGGLQVFLARDVALDLKFFDANRIMKNNRTLINQSLGIRFYL